MRVVCLAGLILAVSLAWSCSSGETSGVALTPCETIGDCGPGEKCEATDPAKPEEKFCIPLCEVAADCPQAYVCEEGQCVQKECTEVTVCPGQENEETYCAPAGVEATQPSTQFCSPIQCKDSADCTKYGANFVCNEYFYCVEGEGGQDVITDTGGTDVVTQDSTPSSGDPCSVCSSDAECGSLKCYPLGGGTHCFGACQTNDDCPTGWMCYALSNDGQQCIPLSFSCDSGCLLDGCPIGQVCNQETGACVTGGAACAPCAQEWDCAEGLRCYQDGKYCAPSCVGGNCEQNSTCSTVNAIPVNLCVSQSPACCYGADCTGGCEDPALPYPCGDACCACTSDNHCPQDQTCQDNQCVSGQCQDPAKPHLCGDGTCNQCCTSAHCADLGAGYVCTPENTCFLDDQPEECSYCEDPYPACTQINGIWSCVQCTVDTDCPGDATCDLTLFACSGGNGGPVGSCPGCTNAADCFSSQGTVLECDAAAGCCYDPAGWCDGVESFCNAPAGSECKGLMDFLGGGLPIPGMPTDMAIGICTCNEPLDMMTLMMCMLGGCPGGGCYGEAVCIDPAILTDLLGGGGLPMPTGDGFCINLSSLLGGLFP